MKFCIYILSAFKKLARNETRKKRNKIYTHSMKNKIKIEPRIKIIPVLCKKRNKDRINFILSLLKME